MQLTTRNVHHVAIVAAAGISGVALFDAATHAITGHYSVFADDTDTRSLLQVGNLVHGLAYATALAVLLQHRERIAALNRVARIVWWLLVGSLAVLGTGFLFVMPFVDPANVPALWGALVGPAFMGMLLGGPVLGLAVRRAPELRPGSVLLVAMLPVLVATLLLGWVAPDAAHPAYLETASAFGLALLGYRAPNREVTVTGSARSRTAV